ncbi:MAG: Gldg family protein [Verrucomicrobiales bacterium]|nr:Gldg family protein [Verrucomicrobiales bacterium]
MTTNKTKWEPLLYSGAGVAAMFLILLAIAVIGNTIKVRLDFTEEKLYTLSQGTRDILRKIDTPVIINFYCTRGENEMPMVLKNYAKRVEDLLAEYRQESRGQIEVRKFDPQPDTEAEDSARLDGVEGQSLSQGGLVSLGNRVYLGLAVSCLDAKEAIPFLDPSRENLLEYDLTRAIAKTINPAKPDLGVLSSLQVFGQMNPNPMMGGGQGSQPWYFIRELQRDFNVREVPSSTGAIDADLQVLVVIHPTNLSEQTLYALDQFVLRGGKLLAFLDPLSIADSRNAMNMQMMMQRTGSTLGPLLKTWGLDFDINKVLADKTFATRISRGNQAAVEPTWLSLTVDGINTDDIVTGDIDSLLMPAAGVFTGTAAEGLTQTVLLKSSPNSDFVDRTMVAFGADTSKEIKTSGKEQTLAVRLTGKFKTAFPDGKPKDAAADGTDNADSTATDATGLKESSTDGVVVLIGDSDMIYDQFCVQIQNFFGQQLVSPIMGNLAFAQNLVELMMGDSALIKVRSRAVKSRPFTVVREMQAQAEERYVARIRQLEQDAQDAQSRIDELTRQQAGQDQRFILPPEAQQEIENLRAKAAEANKELRNVRRQLRSDVDALENRLKWINIAGMPLLVTVAGIALAGVKRKKTAAK